MIDTLNLDRIVLVGWSAGNLEVWSIKQYGYEKIREAVTIDMPSLSLSPDPECRTKGSIKDMRFIATQLLTTPGAAETFSVIT